MPKTNTPENVTDYLQQLEHPLKEEIQLLRTLILQADGLISEQVKWNSPSFYYSGEMKPFDPKEYKRDIVVMHLKKKDSILLVFPTGEKIKDDTGVLEGSYKDGRRMITFKNREEIDEKKESLQQVIRLWLDMVE